MTSLRAAVVAAVAEAILRKLWRMLMATERALSQVLRINGLQIPKTWDDNEPKMPFGKSSRHNGY